MGRLDEKVASINCGARSLGAAEARLFSRGGSKVVVGYVLDDQGRQVEARIHESCGACVFVPLDVTREGNWLEAVAVTTSR